MNQALSAHLQEIWHNLVIPQFSQGNICSERHLQAIFYKDFQLEGVKAWVEPKLSGKNIKLLEGYKPDLLFTQATTILAVMELRFSPYYQLEPQNDLYRFQTFQKEKTDDAYQIYFKINPNNGDLDTQTGFQLADDLQFIYGVIAKNGSPALSPEVGSQYSNQEFTHLKWAVGKD
ncbi:MAG: hypothetical protein MUE85_07610 [Microscillaceae bacterium]|jgi:hypothetical protein|nr:hypothetical protein [Microscillaceae bacterium]